MKCSLHISEKTTDIKRTIIILINSNIKIERWILEKFLAIKV